MDPIMIFLTLMLQKREKKADTGPKKTLSDVLGKVLKKKNGGEDVLKGDVSGDDVLKGSGGTDIVGQIASIQPQIGGTHSSGLPLNLPAGTKIKAPNGQIATLSQLTSTESVISYIIPGSQIITPSGQVWTKPGGVMPQLPAGQPLLLQQGPLAGQGQNLPWYAPVLAGAGAAAVQNAPQLLQAGGELIGDIFGGIGQGASSFWNWLTGDSSSSSSGYNPNLPTYYDAGGAYQLPAFDYEDIQFQ